jgi:hypothetical protein
MGKISPAELKGLSQIALIIPEKLRQKNLRNSVVSAGKKYLPQMSLIIAEKLINT